MRRNLLAVAAILLLSGLTARAQTPPPAPAATAQAVKMVKPGLFMVIGAGGNVTVRITSDGLVVVDTKNAGQPVFDALMARIRTISGHEVKWVIDTHHHGDHSGNNGRFLAAGAKVIAHENLPG